MHTTAPEERPFLGVQTLEYKVFEIRLHTFDFTPNAGVHGSSTSQRWKSIPIRAVSLKYRDQQPRLRAEGHIPVEAVLFPVETSYGSLHRHTANLFESMLSRSQEIPTPPTVSPVARARCGFPPPRRVPRPRRFQRFLREGLFLSCLQASRWEGRLPRQ